MDYRMKIKANPGSSQNRAIWKGDFLKVNLTALPEEGKANQQLIELLSEKFDADKDDIEIIGGRSSENKTVMLYNLDREELVRKMNDLKG